MSIREELEKHCGESAEQRMLILRRELLRPIVTVQTSAKLLQSVEADLTHGLPDPEDRDELQNTIKWLSEAANDLQEILEALACDDVKLPPHHRND
jgi:hypothetical protein